MIKKINKNQKYFIAFVVGLIIFNFITINKIKLNAQNTPTQIEYLKNSENIVNFNEQNLKKLAIDKNTIANITVVINHYSKKIKIENINSNNLYDVLKNENIQNISHIQMISVFYLPTKVNQVNNYKFDNITKSVSLVNKIILGQVETINNTKPDELLKKYKNNIFNLKSKKSGVTAGQINILGKNSDGSYKIATASHVIDELTKYFSDLEANFFLNGKIVKIKSIKNIKKRYDFAYANINFNENLNFNVENIKVKLNEKRNISMYTIHSVTKQMGQNDIVEVESAHYLGKLSKNDRYLKIHLDLTWSTMHTYVGVSGSGIFSENGELLAVLSALDQNLCNIEMFRLGAISPLGMLSRPNMLPTYNNLNKQELKVNQNNKLQSKVNNHKKGWGHNNNGKWIWYTGVGQELYNKPGWQAWKGSWLFENGDRTYATNEWKPVSGKWYHFDNNGYINRGWKHIGNHWYHFTWSGKMESKGWHKIGGKWFYINKGGDLYTKKGWEKNHGHWMYSKGANGYATNERIGKYSFNSNGYMK